MRAAEYQPAGLARLTSHVCNAGRGGELWRCRSHGENSRIGRTGVNRSHLFVVLNPRKVEHLNRIARLFEHGSYSQEAQRHEDPLVEQEDRWRDNKTNG